MKEPKYCELCGDLLEKEVMYTTSRYDMVTGKEIKKQCVSYRCPNYKFLGHSILSASLGHTRMLDIQTYKEKRRIFSLQSAMSNDAARKSGNF